MNCEPKNNQKIKLATGGYMMICTDPENCDEEHNEILANDFLHHYGCDCDDCARYYYLHLK